MEVGKALARAARNGRRAIRPVTSSVFPLRLPGQAMEALSADRERGAPSIEVAWPEPRRGVKRIAVARRD